MVPTNDEQRTGQLISDEYELLKELREAIGSSQIKQRRLQETPSWFKGNAFIKENDDNRSDDYVLMKSMTYDWI